MVHRHWDDPPEAGWPEIPLLILIVVIVLILL